MEQPKQKNTKQRIATILSRQALKRLTKRYCFAVSLSRDASQEILRGLPGVFSMTLQTKDAKLRLIKEADTFRIMKASERSDNLLTIQFEDATILGEIISGECTMQKALSERRMTFAGKTKYLAVFLRAGAQGDKEAISSEDYPDLYEPARKD